MVELLQESDLLAGCGARFGFDVGSGSGVQRAWAGLSWLVWRGDGRRGFQCRIQTANLILGPMPVARGKNAGWLAGWLNWVRKAESR